MRTQTWLSMCAVLWLLAGCGNKGDLYLPNEELTEEQQLLLNALETDEDRAQQLQQIREQELEDAKKAKKESEKESN